MLKAICYIGTAQKRNSIANARGDDTGSGRANSVAPAVADARCSPGSPGQEPSNFYAVPVAGEAVFHCFGHFHRCGET